MNRTVRIVAIVRKERFSRMNNLTTADLPDFAIGRARIFVSLIALLSIYIDPTNGGFLGIEPHALCILLVHLGYSILMYTPLQKTSEQHAWATISVPLTEFFRPHLPFFTEGRST